MKTQAEHDEFEARVKVRAVELCRAGGCIYPFRGLPPDGDEYRWEAYACQAADELRASARRDNSFPPSHQASYERIPA